MSRLIDADKLIQEMSEWFRSIRRRSCLLQSYKKG